MKPTPPLSQAAARIRPPVFSELQARIDRLASRGEELVPLHIGDTHLAPPEAARRALGALDPEDASLYRYGPTAGVAALREAFVRARKLDVDAENEVLVGNGGTHALYCAARAVLDAGDEVLMASPFWPLAPGIFTACGAVPVEVPLTQALYADASFDAGAAFAARVTPRTRGLYLISPNNPDGKVLTRHDLERIAAVAREHDLWVFSDEVYADAIFAGTHESIANVEGMRERTIVLHSLSKSHALAGCRVGFVTAAAPVIASARRVSTHTAFNVSVAMQRAALAALSDEAFPSAARAAYREARDAAAHALEGSGVRFHLAEGATYLFLDFAPVLGDEKLLALLERAVDRGVLLAPGDAFGAAWQTCARLCYTAVPIARVREGCARLRDAIVALREGRP
ncbi:MAG TPA: pyridoxal phosphate-dependent aminotransferase [Labilithrix sp.]|jgi:aspartate/methionine/tyrosine aminotransferase